MGDTTKEVSQLCLKFTDAGMCSDTMDMKKKPKYKKRDPRQKDTGSYSGCPGKMCIKLHILYKQHKARQKQHGGEGERARKRLHYFARGIFNRRR